MAKLATDIVPDIKGCSGLKMSLLREIQSAAIEDSVNIVTLLRKCQLLAARLESFEFRNWVEKELNGYSIEDSLPSYRQTEPSSVGNFNGAFGSTIRNAGLPTALIPQEYRENVEIFKLREPVGAIRSLLENSDKSEPNIHISWNPNLLALVQRRFYKDFALNSACQVVPKFFFQSVLDSVTNRILSFVLEIESKDPSAGDALDGKKAEKRISTEAVQQIVNNNIYGHVGQINNAKQINMNLEVRIGDLDSLTKYLRNNGVSENDVGELVEAIKADGPAKDRIFGEKVASWFGSMVAKTCCAAEQMAIQVTSSILYEALHLYYGW